MHVIYCVDARNATTRTLEQILDGNILVSSQFEWLFPIRKLVQVVEHP
jgi:hypothetical protein